LRQGRDKGKGEQERGKERKESDGGRDGRKP